MKRGKITLEVDNEHMEFDVNRIMNSTPIEVASRIDSIDIIDKCVKEVLPECLKQDSKETHMVQEVSEPTLEVNSYQSSQRTSRFEPLRQEDDPKATISSEEVKLELKPLPSNLRYAFPLTLNFLLLLIQLCLVIMLMLYVIS